MLSLRCLVDVLIIGSCGKQMPLKLEHWRPVNAGTVLRAWAGRRLQQALSKCLGPSHGTKRWPALGLSGQGKEGWAPQKPERIAVAPGEDKPQQKETSNPQRAGKEDKGTCIQLTVLLPPHLFLAVPPTGKTQLEAERPHGHAAHSGHSHGHRTVMGGMQVRRAKWEISSTTCKRS